MRIDKAAALKAVTTWVDLGVLKEEDVTVYRLLEVAEESAPSGSKTVPRPGMHSDCLLAIWRLIVLAAVIEDVPAVLTVQQQQAEQMKVYWKVGGISVTPFHGHSQCSLCFVCASSSRACSLTWAR